MLLFGIQLFPNLWMLTEAAATQTHTQRQGSPKSAVLTCLYKQKQPKDFRCKPSLLIWCVSMPSRSGLAVLWKKAV